MSGFSSILRHVFVINFESCFDKKRPPFPEAFSSLKLKPKEGLTYFVEEALGALASAESKCDCFAYAYFEGACNDCCSDEDLEGFVCE